jgi:nitrate/TMAO reductase-like tetraheme cytochrome c subunit
MAVRKRIIRFAVRYAAAPAAGFAAAVACFALVNTVSARFSKNDYCGGRCHEMKPAYSSWEISGHNANGSGLVADCIDCHLPPKDRFFSHTAVKAYKGAVDVIKHHLGGEYDLEAMRSRVLQHMPDDRCLECHAGLLVAPQSPAAAMAHGQALRGTGGAAARCVECHDRLHERKLKIYSTD